MKIIRETYDTENFRYILTKPTSNMKVRWTGFVHPLNATVKYLNNGSVIYKFKLSVENISVTVRINRDDNTETTVSTCTENFERDMRFSPM